MTATNVVRISSAAASRRASILSLAAGLAFAEYQSRADLIANARSYLGKSPDAASLAEYRAQAIAGRMAARLPFRKGETQDARIAKAFDLSTNYADPVKEGTKAKKLRAGLKGRLTQEQHKVKRAAIEWWNLLLKDVMPQASTRAEGQADKNASAAKRKAKASTVNAKPGKAPTHAQLVAAAPKPETASDVMAFLATQSRMIADYAKKHAKVCPADAGKAVEAFRTAILAAANALQERLAVKDANAAAAGR